MKKLLFASTIIAIAGVSTFYTATTNISQHIRHGNTCDEIAWSTLKAQGEKNGLVNKEVTEPDMKAKLLAAINAMPPATELEVDHLYVSSDGMRFFVVMVDWPDCFINASGPFSAQQIVTLSQGKSIDLEGGEPDDGEDN